MRSFFGLLDDSTFEGLCSDAPYFAFESHRITRPLVLAKIHCEPDEEITSVIPFSADIDGVCTPFFIAGTCIYQPEETEPEKGRLLLISISTTNNPRSPRQSYQLSLAASTEVKGCVYSLTPTSSKNKEEQRFVAAVNSSILLFQLWLDKGASPAILALEKITEWNHNYLVTSLAAVDNRVFAGDQISSVSLLEIQENKFNTEARDYGPRWPVSIEAIDGKNVIGANVCDLLASLSCYFYIDDGLNLRMH